MSNVYTRFSVDNFRQFDRLAVDNIARVNLVAGQNNAGKTTLLEALWLFSNPTRPVRARQLSRWRGLSPREATETFISLFRGYNPDLTITMQAFGEWGDNARTLVIKNQPRAQRTLPIALERLDTGESFIDLFDLDLDNETVFEYFDAKGSTFITRAWYEDEQRSYRPVGASLREEGQVSADRNPCVFIHTERQPGSYALAGKFGKAEIEGRITDVQRLVQLAEPRLKRLTAIPRERGGALIYGDIGFGRIIPVAMMGGGVHRLLDLALSFSEAKNGVILIDEVESGLHHTVLIDVWKDINRLSLEFNVQVFATTHSYECLIAARNAFQAMGNRDLCIHRLSRDDDGYTSTTYQFEGLDFTLDYGAEIR